MLQSLGPDKIGNDRSEQEGGRIHEVESLGIIDNLVALTAQERFFEVGEVGILEVDIFDRVCFC